MFLDLLDTFSGLFDILLVLCYYMIFITIGFALQLDLNNFGNGDSENVEIYHIF